MDVLNRQARIRLVKPDGSAIRPSGEVNELLKMLSAGRRRRAFREFEQKIEYLSDILREIGDVLVEVAIVDGEETDLVVLQRHELREVGRADGVQVCRYPAPPGAKKQLRFKKGEARFGRQDHQEG